jgi:cholesterol transport system auxiliary component
LGWVRRVGRTSHGLALALTLSGASGCAVLAPPHPATTYDLQAPESFPRRSAGAQGTLIVPEPTALRAIDTDRILVKPAAAVVAYYPDAQWSDRLPRLIQTRIIQAFENASRLRSVGRPGDGLTPDYQLVTDIRSFEIEAGPAPTAQVEISAKLVSIQSGRAPAARVFTVRVPARSENVDQGISALDTALSQALVEMVTWATGVI